MNTDLAIIGAGPAGLAAAIYTAREGLGTTVFEKDVVIGGLAAITDTIENYPGFAQGIKGMELADALEEQAKRFGATILTDAGVHSLQPQAGKIQLTTKLGQHTAGAVLISSGNHYRHLEVPGEAEYIGKGVHFCATCDGPLYRDRRLVVVGGGNSALQEGLFLTRFASRVVMLVRAEQLKGSQVLIDRVKANPKFEIHYRTRVEAIAGDGRQVTSVRAVDGSGQTLTYETDGVFVFVGLVPNTNWLRNIVELDEHGFVVTDAGLATNMPGVFAAGDVRSGSTFQIASAVGEGVNAALKIRYYLEQLG